MGFKVAMVLHLPRLPAILLMAGSLAWLGCSSSSGEGLACGSGTTEMGKECVALTLDASLDAAPETGGDGGGADAAATAPTFGGVTAVAPASATALFVVWSAATDPTSVATPPRYRVYVGPSDKPLTYQTPAVLTEPGALGAVVGGLQATEYVVGVRAVSVAGIDDGNMVQLKGTPSADTTAPTFAGLKTAKTGGGGAVNLSWGPATDNLTPAAAMTYLVYMSSAAGMEDFTSPALVTAPGATTTTVGRLPNAIQARYFVVRARDAAGNADANTVELSATPGVDVTAPVFGGCTAATNLQAIVVSVGWSPASDDVSTPDDISYDVFSSTSAGTFDFTQPLATVKGASQVTIGSLHPSTTYYFVCRAKDEAGNEDANTVEVSATTGSNPVPPTFAGITGFTGDPVARTATISWSPATDVATPAAQMLYDVYEAEASMSENFTQPPLATSAPGAMSVGLTSLPPNATLYFVVRARDSDGNRDANTVEQPGAPFATNVSFSLNAQPIFSRDCGVVGCHVPGNPTGGLILAQGFAYAQIVGVAAGEGAGLGPDGGALDYINPGDTTGSYLYRKINPSVGTIRGTQMPAAATGSTLAPTEIDTIANWITQGAVNN